MPTKGKGKKAAAVKATVEQLETNKVKVTINMSAEKLREGLTFAYNRNKNYFNIPGFRQGKAPRRLVEQMYGRDIFHEEAINHILPAAYEDALATVGVDAVYRPDLEPGEISEATGAIFFATVVTRPTAEISDYTGIEVPKGEPEATPDEITKALQAELEKNSRQVSVDRAAELKDIVMINFKGYTDDQPFDGGEGENHELTLGSGQFIPGFEDQLVGSKSGDKVTVNVDFPAEYHHPDLAGKPARFDVEILDVQGKQLPEMDDDFAQDVSEFDTLDEYKADLAKKISESKAENLDNARRGFVMKKLIELCKVDIPEEMYLGRLDDMFQDFAHSIRMRGMDIESYMRFSGMTELSMKAAWRPQAERDVQGQLALIAVYTKEELTVDKAEFEERFGKIADKKGRELKKLVKELTPSRRKELERGFLCEKALDIVMEKIIDIDGPLPTDELAVPEEEN
jgi:trigger factor